MLRIYLLNCPIIFPKSVLLFFLLPACVAPLVKEVEVSQKEFNDPYVEAIDIRQGLLGQNAKNYIKTSIKYEINIAGRYTLKKTFSNRWIVRNGEGDKRNAIYPLLEIETTEKFKIDLTQSDDSLMPILRFEKNSVDVNALAEKTSRLKRFLDFSRKEDAAEKVRMTWNIENGFTLKSQQEPYREIHLGHEPSSKDLEIVNQFMSNPEERSSSLVNLKSSRMIVNREKKAQN